MVYATLVFLTTLLIPYLFWSELLDQLWDRSMDWFIENDPEIAAMVLYWGAR